YWIINGECQCKDGPSDRSSPVLLRWLVAEQLVLGDELGDGGWHQRFPRRIAPLDLGQHLAGDNRAIGLVIIVKRLDVTVFQEKSLQMPKLRLYGQGFCRNDVSRGRVLVGVHVDFHGVLEQPPNGLESAAG